MTFDPHGEHDTPTYLRQLDKVIADLGVTLDGWEAAIPQVEWLLAEARWRADRLRASALGSHGTGPDPAYEPHPWDDYEPHCTDTA